MMQVVVVQPAVEDSYNHIGYDTDIECFHDHDEMVTYRKLRVVPRPPAARRLIYYSLVPIIIIVIVVSVVVSNNNNNNNSTASSASASSSNYGAGTYTGSRSAPAPSSPTTSGVNNSPSAPTAVAPIYTAATPSSSTGGSGTAPAIAPSNTQPSAPLSSSSSSPSPSTSSNSGTFISSGPLYDESVLANHWLYAHNTRRQTFYAQHNLSPKDLKWSAELAASAQNYSESLLTLPGCIIKHGFQGNHYGGENVAMMWDTGIAVTVLPELVLQAWFDNEQGMPFGENGHWSQVAWRGSGYLGCGTAKKVPSSGLGCFVSTCRYIATGNCNMDASNQMSVMLQDTSPCPPACPSEGCF